MVESWSLVCHDFQLAPQARRKFLFLDQPELEAVPPEEQGPVLCICQVIKLLNILVLVAAFVVRLLQSTLRPISLRVRLRCFNFRIRWVRWCMSPLPDLVKDGSRLGQLG